MKSFLVILTVLVTFSSFSQSDTVSSKYRFGVAIAANTTNGFDYGRPISFFITVSKNKHEFDLGPRLYFEYMNATNHQSGVDFMYRYYIKGTEKRYSPFFYGHATYFNRLYIDDKSYMQDSTLIKYDEKIVSNGAALSLGVGLNYKVYEEFYLAMNFGLGYVYQYQKVNGRYEDMPDLNYVKKVDGGHSIFSGAILIGYKF